MKKIYIVPKMRTTEMDQDTEILTVSKPDIETPQPPTPNDGGAGWGDGEYDI